MIAFFSFSLDTVSMHKINGCMNGVQLLLVIQLQGVFEDAYGDIKSELQNKANCKKKKQGVHVLISMNNWTNKGEIVYIST